MGLGNNRAIKYANESGGYGGIFGTAIAAYSIGATAVIINNPGGSNFGVQPAAIGQTLYFLDGVGEAPKLVSNAVNTSTQSTLTIPALTANHLINAKMFLDQAPSVMTLLETFKVNRDPKNWSPTPYTQTRAGNVAQVPGRQETSGSLSFMARPTVNGGLLAKAIGQDNVSAPLSGSPLATTTTGTNNAGINVLNVTLGTGYVANDFIQIEATGNAKVEVHKVLSAAAGTITLVVGEATFYAHNAGVAVARVIAPFLHTIPSANSFLSSIHLEDYVPYDDPTTASQLTTNSYFVPGALFNKLTLEGKTTDGIMVTGDFLAQSKELNIASAFAATPSENPFFFQQEAVLISAAQMNRITSIKIDINNNLQVIYAKFGSSRPFAIKAGMQEVKGELMLYEDAVSQLIFWNNFVTNTQFNLTWTFTDAATAFYISVVMTKIVLGGFNDQDFNPGDLVNAKIPFVAVLDPATNVQFTLLIANGQWLPF